MDTRSGKKNTKNTKKPMSDVSEKSTTSGHEAHGVEEPVTNNGIWELLCTIRSDITKILDENKRQSEVIQELKKSIEFESGKREDLEKRCKKLEDDLNSTRKVLEDSEKKRALEDGKLEDLEQYTRKYNLEVSGLSCERDSTDRELIILMAKTLDVELDDKDMDIVHRLNVKNGTPPIIIRFSTYQAKQRLYKARKLARNIDWSSIFGYHTSVYINENLTKKRRNLFMVTRRSVKLNTWFGCWTIDGKIFLKKTQESKPYIIRSVEDINKS